MGQRTEKYIKTEENWCGNYANDTVEVSKFVLEPYSDEDVTDYRVFVSGTDDLAMFQDYTTQKQADVIYDKIIDNITQDDLEEMGLEYF